MSDQFSRRLPVGAEVVPTGGVHFRVWAPERDLVEVAVTGEKTQFFKLEPESEGYWSGHVPQAGSGTRYKFRLNREQSYPDPASRFQPDGPHGDSQVVDPAHFGWNDQNWPGVSIEGQVVYEVHIGAFTPEGTWAAASAQLATLADLGVTVLEVMPVNDFAGKFNWGYDGVDQFAPTRLYGTPDDFRRFVNEAHALKMGVILDVVYNHLGPDGNYLPAFSPHYFTSKHETDWGEAINFYAEHSLPVREFFITNAGYWIDEFHLDGLRLDATQNIYDESKDHILAAITRQVRKAAGSRSTILIGENEPQNTRLIRPQAERGYGIDSLWNDDFHHSAMVRLTGHNEAYYTDYLGTPQEFISAAKYGYLYQGQWYLWQHARRGTSAYGCKPEAFVNFIQNHDQVANSARGARAHTLASPGMLKAMTALMILMPGTPMLFMGQEFASSSPFLFFADQKPEIGPLVREGRRKFLAQFRSLALHEMYGCFADPCDEKTFMRSKLDHSEREKHNEIFQLHKDLLKLRREEKVFREQRPRGVDGAVLSPDAFLIRYFGADDSAEDRLLLVNFGRDLHLNPAPEPLLAPPMEREWDVIWSSEQPGYGGCGAPAVDTVENWRIPGQGAVVLKPVPRTRTDYWTLKGQA